MDATERPQEAAEGGPSALTRVAMHFAFAIAIVIARPFVLAVVDGRVHRLGAMITAVLIGIDYRALRRDCFGDDALTGGLICMPNYPAALFARLATDDMDDRWPIVVVRAM